MNFVKFLIFFALVGLLGWGIYNLTEERKIFYQEVKKLEDSVNALESENKLLAAEIEYFKKPENLLKELRSQFNYKIEGEKMIIIVPAAATTTNTGQ